MRRHDLFDVNRLRIRLILGCCVVAFVVSSIFIYSSLRLSTDLTHELEIEALDRESRHSLSKLEGLYLSNHASLPTAKILCSALADWSVEGLESFLVVSSENTRSECHFGADGSVSENTTGLDLEKFSSMRSFEALGQYYATSNVSSDIAPITLWAARTNVSNSKLREFVVKRLSIISFITFWAAVWVAIVVSVTVSRRIEASNKKLAHLATHDDLTGVYNHFYLVEQISSYDEANSDGEKATLVFVDLSCFKEINDNLGHALGDIILCVIAQRLNSIIGDQGIVGRLGGDEFFVWLEDSSPRETLKIVEQLNDACSKPIQFDHESVSIGAHIGAAVYPDHGTQPNELLRHADEAVIRAKNIRQNFVVYAPEHFSSTQYRLKLRSQIADAIKNEEFQLFYQPKINLTNGKVVGAEALARWQHPAEGLLAPFAFIDLVEHGNFVHDFGFYILAKAISQVADWRRRGFDFSIAVNLSPYNMLNPDLPAKINELLTQHKVPASALEIELTESGTMIDLNAIANMFTQLHALGVVISIDDFGTGMSSFAYLKKLRVDIVKIDREFIRDLDTREQDELVVAGIISLCNKMRKQVVAEGVETLEHQKKLQQMGCELAQGFLYAKPLPEADFLKFIQGYQRDIQSLA